VGYTTLEPKTSFVRAITRDTGRILCDADVVHRGGTIGNGRAA
jgi:acyl-coenzyme A thioesterase PaaI-like protein